MRKRTETIVLSCDLCGNYIANATIGVKFTINEGRVKHVNLLVEDVVDLCESCLTGLVLGKSFSVYNNRP